MTPFSLTTADNQTLYAWHVLPLPLYAQHEAALSSQPTGFSHDITATLNFRLLRDDPTSKLIISCESIHYRHPPPLTDIFIFFS